MSHGDWMDHEHAHWTPNVNVHETQEGLRVIMEVAGVEKENLSLTLTDQFLVVEGLRSDPCCAAAAKKKYQCRQMEVEFGLFRRVVRLACPVDASACRAVMRHGMLEIDLPRARRRREIHRELHIPLDHEENPA